MRRISKKLVKSQRGASLVEYTMIVALLSLIVVAAVPRVGLEVGRMSCNVVTLGQYNYVIVGRIGKCYHTTSEADLGGDTHMGQYW